MKYLKKAAAIAAAAAMTAAQFTGISNVFAAGETTFPYTIEGENMEGASLWKENYGPAPKEWSGDGFAYLTNGTLSFTVTVPEDGMYDVSVKAIQVLNEDGREQTCSVNGNEKMMKVGYTEDWVDVDFGLFRMNKGENTIEFPSKYGYMAIDTVTVSKADKHDYAKATDVCVDSKATAETQALMKYLKSVYGKHVISGQQEIYGGGHKNNYEWENEFLEDLTGKVPAIRGLDFMNYNPLYGWEDGTTERAIAWVKERNGILTASWHINVPIDFENYTLGDEVDWKQCTYKNYQASNSTFNTANVLKEGTKEQEYFNEAIKMLAEQLKKLQDENIPIIFRPLHEAQGNDGLYGDGTAWFWWGDRGPEVYKELWKYLYTQLTEKYELHNIIWEFNSYDYESSPKWYPGDEYVDIVAYDKYNVEYNRGDGKSSGPNLLAIAGKFHSLYQLTDGKKMVAMAENDTIPALDNLLVEDAGWLYFCPWYDGGEDGGTAFLGENYQDYDELKKMYQSEYCITLDELPADLYGGGSSSETTKSTTTATTTSKTTTSSKSTETTASTTAKVDGDVLYGDANVDGEVTLSDAVLVMQSLANPGKFSKTGSDKNHITEKGEKNADCESTGNGITNKDALAIQKYMLKLIDKLPEMPAK
ncbi:MAG: beta-mannosidase [Ruminococcus sp.]|nr:beta-mannosidase [Ruminococcus sp.]